MEQLPFDSGGLKEPEIRAFLNKMVEKEILTEAESAEVLPERIEGFYHSDIGRRVCAAESVYRELPFNLLKERGGETIIVQGTIDCCFSENGRYILLDYKTNFTQDSEESAEALADFYRPQLALYKEALEEIMHVEVEEVYLYLFATGREIRL